MKKFIFITAEGYTYQPGSDSATPDIENLQVLGFGEGGTVEEAFLDMIDENPYLMDTNFDEAIGMELKNWKRKALSLGELRK